jgi:hypothetical protein
MKTVIICFWLLVGTGGLLLASESTKPCTKEDSIRADAEAASLKNWAEVYKVYKEFVQCDQAGIAEGYSESIARLLSEEWKNTDQLNRLVLDDKGFETFILRHIDELMTPSQAAKIRENADTKCPSHAESLCHAISRRLKEVDEAIKHSNINKSR